PDLVETDKQLAGGALKGIDRLTLGDSLATAELVGDFIRSLARQEIAGLERGIQAAGLVQDCMRRHQKDQPLGNRRWKRLQILAAAAHQRCSAAQKEWDIESELRGQPLQVRERQAIAPEG